ncbi:MAG: (Na+)-NQR maturation NqrM [Acidobacteriota bacterium]
MSWTILFLTLGIFLTVVLAMAVGVIFNRPCLRGSCGGPSVVGANGESLSCSTCPNRDKDKQRQSESSAPTGGLRVVR